jgi:hypothetical protein
MIAEEPASTLTLTNEPPPSPETEEADENEPSPPPSEEVDGGTLPAVTVTAKVSSVISTANTIAYHAIPMLSYADAADAAWARGNYWSWAENMILGTADGLLTVVSLGTFSLVKGVAKGVAKTTVKVTAKGFSKPLQKGGNKIKESTLKALNLTKEQGRDAIHALKKANGLPPNAHFNIMSDGSVVHPHTGLNYGTLFEYLP